MHQSIGIYNFSTGYDNTWALKFGLIFKLNHYAFMPTGINSWPIGHLTLQEFMSSGNIMETHNISEIS
ncbi:hypothetical protein E2C01_092593 [Portunus trituberculatus]|uniref:Uncharacterized protein n=1 Tax=Portunus trituberculatus TaxID=210409 RepID=A0A5B7JW77_PORTR|nr:hypothetical protein [Portunus trituberculatus]